MPKKVKKGDNILQRKAVKPLFSKSVVKINIQTRYGKSLTAKGIAPFAPSINES